MQITQILARQTKQDKASFHQLFPHLLQTIHVIGKMAAMFMEPHTVYVEYFTQAINELVKMFYIL